MDKSIDKPMNKPGKNKKNKILKIAFRLIVCILIIIVGVVVMKILG